MPRSQHGSRAKGVTFDLTLKTLSKPDTELACRASLTTSSCSFLEQFLTLSFTTFLSKVSIKSEAILQKARLAHLPTLSPNHDCFEDPQSYS